MLVSVHHHDDDDNASLSSVSTISSKILNSRLSKSWLYRLFKVKNDVVDTSSPIKKQAMRSSMQHDEKQSIRKPPPSLPLAALEKSKLGRRSEVVANGAITVRHSEVRSVQLSTIIPTPQHSVASKNKTSQSSIITRPTNTTTSSFGPSTRVYRSGDLFDESYDVMLAAAAVSHGRLDASVIEQLGPNERQHVLRYQWRKRLAASAPVPSLLNPTILAMDWSRTLPLEQLRDKRCRKRQRLAARARQIQAMKLARRSNDVMKMANQSSIMTDKAAKHEPPDNVTRAITRAATLRVRPCSLKRVQRKHLGTYPYGVDVLYTIKEMIEEEKEQVYTQQNVIETSVVLAQDDMILSKQFTCDLSPQFTTSTNKDRDTLSCPISHTKHLATKPSYAQSPRTDTDTSIDILATVTLDAVNSPTV